MIDLEPADNPTFGEKIKLFYKDIEPILFAPLEWLGNPFVGIPVMLFGGFMLGTHTVLLIQLVVLGYWIAFLNSWSCRKYELGSFIFMLGFLAFIVGIVGGNISYYYQVQPELGVWEFIVNLFVVN